MENDMAILYYNVIAADNSVGKEAGWIDIVWTIKDSVGLYG